MATWRTYATGVFVTGGILIGTLTYRYVTGQATAELAGAAWERSVVARLYGTNAPAFWYEASVTTNRVTNYTATVTLEYASGVQNVDFSTTSLEFSSTNWSVAQLVSVTRKVPWTPGSGTYDVKFNGATETQVFYSAQNPGAGPGFAFGAAVGPNISWTPLTTGVGDDEPALSTVVLTHSPTNGTMTVSTSMVVTAVSGMAAITPFVRNDQMRYFMDQLRNSMQEGYEGGALWWLDPGYDFGALSGAVGIASYDTPKFYATEDRWSASGTESDWISGWVMPIYPTGGVVWARNVDGPVTSTPSFYTLNTMALTTNAVPKLNYYDGLFGWSGSTTDRLGRVMFVPSAVFPYGETAHTAFDHVDMSGYTRANGSWWFDAGMHSNTMWQVQGNEFVTNGSIKRSSYIATNDFMKCGVMAAAMTSTLARVTIKHDSNTVSTVTVLDDDAAPVVTVTTNTVGESGGSVSVASAQCSSLDIIQETEHAGGVRQYVYLSEYSVWMYNTVTTVPADSYTTNSTLSRYLESRRVTGAYVDYPSAYAITNGYVSRVRVYLVYTAARGVVANPFAATLGGVYPENWRNTSWGIPIYGDEFCDIEVVSETPSEGTGSDVTTLSVSNTGEWFFTDDDTDFFGLGIAAQGYNTPPDLVLDETGRTLGQYSAAASGTSAGLAKVRVTLAADISNPTEYPVRFSFGPTDPAFPESFDYTGEILGTNVLDIAGAWEFPADYGNSSCDYNALATMTDMTTTEALVLRQKSTDRSVSCSAYVLVLVDWNFKHMNPANPYTPEPFVPAWLTPAP